MGAADSRAAARLADRGLSCRSCAAGEDLCDFFEPADENREGCEIRGALVEEPIVPGAMAQAHAFAVLAARRPGKENMAQGHGHRRPPEGLRACSNADVFCGAELSCPAAGLAKPRTTSKARLPECDPESSAGIGSWATMPRSTSKARLLDSSARSRSLTAIVASSLQEPKSAEQTMSMPRTTSRARLPDSQRREPEPDGNSKPWQSERVIRDMQDSLTEKMEKIGHLMNRIEGLHKQEAGAATTGLAASGEAPQHYSIATPPHNTLRPPLRTLRFSDASTTSTATSGDAPQHYSIATPECDDLPGPLSLRGALSPLAPVPPSPAWRA